MNGAAPMPDEFAVEEATLLRVYRGANLALVRTEGPDLTLRQLTILLTVYMFEEVQTVRGLAADLKISKPAVTRALDRLSDFDLLRRKRDPNDRRSVNVTQTHSGKGYIRTLNRHLVQARREALQKTERRG